MRELLEGEIAMIGFKKFYESGEHVAGASIRDRVAAAFQGHLERRKLHFRSLGLLSLGQ